ncbi:hypothetical protein A2U01_0003464, partial [Trifolium medium]|nr:hypothetical protein [Trifolium medium]
MVSASSSAVQNPLNPLGLPQIISIGKSFLVTGDVMQFDPSLLKFCYDKMVDFESLKVNGFDVEELFLNQGWKRYFEMLNSPIFTKLIKEFWMKSKVYDDLATRMEEEHIVLKDPSLKGKTRQEMGLKEGRKISDYKNELCYRDAIKKELYEDESLIGKSKGLKDKCLVLFKIFISSIVPRSGGTDTISWEHKHFIYFLLKGKKINLLDLLFESLCQVIRDGNFRRYTYVAYPRLLSELFFQTKLVKVLRRFYPHLVKEERATKLDAGFLTRMGIKHKVVKPQNPLKVRYEDHLYCNGFLDLSEADDEEVIQFFLQDLKKDTGIDVPMSMVPSAPTVDLYKPRKRKASAKEGKKEVKKEAKKDVKKEVLKEAKPEPQEEKKEESKKRKSEGVVIDNSESRIRRKHENKAKGDSFETDSDDGKTLAEKFKQKAEAEASKAPQKHPSKGKSSETIIDHSAEAHVDPNIGFSKPLTTILPEHETVYVSSTSTTDTAELHKEADAIIQEGVTRFGKIPNSESIAKQLFVQEPTPDLIFLEQHLSPDLLSTQMFTHEQPQQTQPQSEIETNTTSEQPNQISPQPETNQSGEIST